MLDALDLDVRLDKKTYREAKQRLGVRLPVLQRALYEAGVPIVIAFEGWYASGRGDGISRVVHAMDPRATRVHVTHASSVEDRLRPWPWRFWRRLPPRGSIAVLDRSWHYLLWNRRTAGELDDAAWERELRTVREFERYLLDDDTVLIKFWLHISRKEQKRRLKDWAGDSTQRWRVSDEDWQRHRDYDNRLEVAERLLARTHTHRAPWTLVEADDNRHRRIRILQTLTDVFTRELRRRGVEVPGTEALLEADREARARPIVPEPDPLAEAPAFRDDSPLSRVDLGKTLDDEEYDSRLREGQSRLRSLQFRSFMKRLPVVMVFEGWDAGGKGGAIKRMTARIDPRGYAVVPIGAPTAREKDHPYLWRFWKEIPKDGHWTVFDRSWYGRVLVERVEGFASETEWKRAYEEINEFERCLVEHGTVVVKFWLHISPDEQLRRFREREHSVLKRHKLTDDDWRNRARWPQYLDAVEEMLVRTSTVDAPWTLVEGDDKRWARVRVVETVVDALRDRLGD